MTYEEAKECVIYFKSNPETEDTETIECANILFDKILEALEKQIPKPKHKYMGYRCVCGEEVAKNQDYCEYCGQRLLDWRNAK